MGQTLAMGTDPHNGDRPSQRGQTPATGTGPHNGDRPSQRGQTLQWGQVRLSAQSAQRDKSGALPSDLPDHQVTG